MVRPLLVVLCLLLAGCTGDAERPAETEVAFDPLLHDELIQMMEDDQASRTGGELVGSDQERTDRLREIVAEHGWPTFDLVGEDGEEAAWVIAQHSDLDPDFPCRTR